MLLFISLADKKQFDPLLLLLKSLWMNPSVKYITVKLKSLVCPDTSRSSLLELTPAPAENDGDPAHEYTGARHAAAEPRVPSESCKELPGDG